MYYKVADAQCASIVYWKGEAESPTIAALQCDRTNAGSNYAPGRYSVSIRRPKSNEGYVILDKFGRHFCYVEYVQE